MRIVTNKKLASRNRKITTYLFFLTFAVLIGGFFLINSALFTNETPSVLILLLQTLILPVALILTLFSIRMTNKWARRPYPETVIEEGLKGLSNKSVLYNYHHSSARHVLVCPQGVFAIITRWHDGKFSIEGDRWTTHKSAISRIFSAMRFDGIGNPTNEAEKATAHLRELLQPIAPNVEVLPLIVFTDTRAEFEVTSTEIPILYADPKQKPNLKSFMRDLNRNNAEQDSSQKSKATLPLSEEELMAFEEATIR